MAVSAKSVQLTETQTFNHLSSWFHRLIWRLPCLTWRMGHQGCDCDQCAHTSFAQRWLWRSQERAEERSMVKTCSWAELTAVYWMTKLGCGIEAAERRRLPAERYSLSPLWVLDNKQEEEEEEEKAVLNMNDNRHLTNQNKHYLFRVMLRLLVVFSAGWRMMDALTVMNISKASTSSTSSNRQGTISAMNPGGADTPW